MSRSIAVVGIPRTGTSCVAGILHKLGVNMGAGNFQNKDKFNPRGYYEDLRWRYTNQQLTGKGYSTKGLDIKGINLIQKTQYKQLVTKCEGSPIWGMKDPFLCFVGKFILPLLSDVRIVATVREFGASVASVQRHIQKSYKGRHKLTALQIMDRWREGYYATIGGFEGSVLVVDYDKLINNPRSHVDLLADFAFGGLSVRPSGKRAKIAAWVTPELRHF